MARLVWLKDELLQAANDEIRNTPREVWEDEPKLIPSLQVFHYHNDHLGTPNELSDDEGNIIWLADYEAWGNTAKVIWYEERLEQLQIEKDYLQPIRFQGQYLDTETGLHYNRFRYYDPDLGMFVSRDPIGLMGGSNVFQYAPNPTGWVDPFGLAKCIQNTKITPPTLPDKVIYNDGIVRIWHNYGNLNPPPGVPVEHAPIHFHVSVKGTSDEYKVFASGKNLRNSKPLPRVASEVFAKNRSKFSSIEKRIGRWYSYMKSQGCV